MSKEIKTARNGGYKLAALLALAAAFAASGDEWYVDPVNGLDTRDGTTSNVVSATVGPRKTLEYAMKLVGAGDTLWLLPGEYNEGSMNSGRARIYVEKSNVKVKSTGGAANTFIVGSGGTDITRTSAMQCARVGSGITGVIFEGVTFKDGCAQNLGDGVIKDNGGGLGDYTEGYTTWAVDCVFTNCWAKYGGGMYHGNALRCRFVDCYAFSSDYGCAISQGKNFAFCLFYNCSTNYAATFYPYYYSTGDKFYNCTFYGTTGNAFCQDWNVSSVLRSVLNSIIVGYAENGHAGMYATNSVMGAASCADTFNCVTGASVADSGLVSPSEGDFRVTESSAAASLGDASMLAGFPAPTGYSLDRDLAGNAVPSSGAIPAGCLVETRSCHIYVDCVNGSDAHDGTQANPYKTIRMATENAISGDIIHVAPGTYGEAEGALFTTATATAAFRVIIPEGVTVESTGGATNTFIIGAPAEGANIDNATYGTGTNAVRCVYARAGATLRGFTLTGGRGVGGSSGANGGAAFYSKTARAATVEDCIISNNVAYNATIYQAVVRRCRVIGNIGNADNGLSGSAGNLCSWYNCIIANNRGDGTLAHSVSVENCTFGTGNDMSGGGSARVLYWWDRKDHAIKNCAVLYGRYYCASPGKICLTNCLVMAANVGSDVDVGRSYNTIFTNSSAAQMDSEYRPILGRFVGIDASDVAYSTEALGDTDFYGTPRILNGAIDIGAVEYDWRPTFNAEIGRRFKLAYASPTVTTNATGGLLVPDGAVAGTAGMAGPYEFRFEMTGGSAQVFVGGVLTGEASGTGAQSIRFNVPDAATEIRFTFTPNLENPGAVLLRKFAGARGFSISFR